MHKVPSSDLLFAYDAIKAAIDELKENRDRSEYQDDVLDILEEALKLLEKYVE